MTWADLGLQALAIVLCYPDLANHQDPVMPFHLPGGMNHRGPVMTFHLPGGNPVTGPAPITKRK